MTRCPAHGSTAAQAAPRTRATKAHGPGHLRAPLVRAREAVRGRSVRRPVRPSGGRTARSSCKGAPAPYRRASRPQAYANGLTISSASGSQRLAAVGRHAHWTAPLVPNRVGGAAT
ncbi:hypothetical protein YW7DRAFT_00600 [Streptomyces sp. AmelKG-E11A]|nr:hypothetical protein YW7DRAFT_00600 [Streptomyces sp. AmelKG-E11A]